MALISYVRHITPQDFQRFVFSTYQQLILSSPDSYFILPSSKEYRLYAIRSVQNTRLNLVIQETIKVISFFSIYSHITITWSSFVSARADTGKISLLVNASSTIQTWRAAAFIIICQYQINFKGIYTREKKK